MFSDQWIEWLYDERDSIVEPTETTYYRAWELLLRASEDVYSVPLWVGHIKFVEDTADDIFVGQDDFVFQETEKAYEKAIGAVGRHPKYAKTVWMEYLKFLRDELEEVEEGEEASEGHRNMQEKIVKFFQQWLQVPSPDTDMVRQMFEAWVEESPTRQNVCDDTRKQQMVKLAKQSEQKWKQVIDSKEVTTLAEIEEKIVEKEDELSENTQETQIYGSSAQHELKQLYLSLIGADLDPIHKRNVFDRAVSSCFGDYDIWKKYRAWVNSTITMVCLQTQFYRRAVKACFADPSTWVGYLEALELNGGDTNTYGYFGIGRKEARQTALERMGKAEVLVDIDTAASVAQKIFGGLQKDVNSVFNIWQAWLNAYRRQVQDGQEASQRNFRDIALKLQNYCKRTFDASSTAFYALTRKIAITENEVLGDSNEANRLWDALMEHQPQRMEAFMEAFTAARWTKDYNRCRKILQRGMEQFKNNSEIIEHLAYYWESLENEIGSVQSLWKAKQNCSSFRKHALREAAKKQKHLPKQKGKRRQTEDSKQVPSKKRKVTTTNDPAQAVANESRSNSSENGTHSTQDSSVLHPSSESTSPAAPEKTDGDRHEVSVTNQPSGTSEKKKKKGPANTQSAEFNHDNSIFVKNLDFDAGETELHNFFQGYGEVAEVSLVKDNYGRSRGFAYIRFKDPGSVSSALQANGSKIKSRPVHVSKFAHASEREVDAEGTPSKYEPWTIFIGHLGEETTEAELRSLFGSIGNGIERVSLPIDKKTGKRKGHALIEFKHTAKDESSTVEEALKLTGSKLEDGKKISVTRAKQGAKALSKNVHMLAGKQTTSHHHPKSRLSTLLVPRSVGKKRGNNPSKTPTEQQTSKEEAQEGPTSPISKDNDYFRQLLQGSEMK